MNDITNENDTQDTNSNDAPDILLHEGDSSDSFEQEVEKEFEKLGSEDGEESDDSDSEKEEKPESKPKDTPEDIQRKHNAAFKEERVRRQELERKIQKMEDVFSQFQQKLQTPQAPVEEIPSYDDDPIEHLNAKQKQLDQYIQNQQQQQQMLQQQQLQQQQYSKVVQEYQSEAQKFSEETPDFKEAYSHLVNQREAQYQAAGYTKAEANQLIIEDELAIISRAKQNYQNPAEIIYNVAKSAGYRPSSKEGQFDNINRGLSQGKSLGGVSGKSSGSPMTLERMAELDGDEFDKAWSKLVG